MKLCVLILIIFSCQWNEIANDNFLIPISQLMVRNETLSIFMFVKFVSLELGNLNGIIVPYFIALFP